MRPTRWGHRIWGLFVQPAVIASWHAGVMPAHPAEAALLSLCPLDWQQEPPRSHKLAPGRWFGPLSELKSWLDSEVELQGNGALVVVWHTGAPPKAGPRVRQRWLAPGVPMRLLGSEPQDLLGLPAWSYLVPAHALLAALELGLVVHASRKGG